MTFVEFVECAMDIQFLEYQKEYLNELYEKIERGEKIIFLPARGSNRFNWLPLYIIMSTLYREQLERSKK